MSDFELIEINASSPVTQAATPILQTMARIVYLALVSFSIAVTITINYAIDRFDTISGFQILATFTLTLLLCFILMGVGAGMWIWTKLNSRSTGFWKFAFFFSSLPFLYYFFGFIIYSMLNAPSVIPAWR